MSPALPGDSQRRECAAAPIFTCSGGTAAGRLAEAVQQARFLPLSFKEANFDQNIWEVTEADVIDLGRPGKTGRRFVRFEPFTPFNGRGVPMPACVCGFAKAFFRRMPMTSLNVVVARREAIGLIGLELEARGIGSISGCTPSVLDGAVDRARTMRKDVSIVGMASQIGLVARTLRNYRLTEVPIGEWVPSPREPNAASDALSQKSPPLLADGYLDDLGAAFRRATNPVDVVLFGILVLQACCVGPRVGSVIMLSEDCIDGLDYGDGLAIRWPAFKSLPEEVIDVPEPVAPFVRDVIKRVLSITAEARAVKKLYDACPDVLHLPPELEHVREAGWVTRDEAMRLTGLRDCGLMASLVRSGKVGVEDWPGKRKAVSRLSFPDIERDYLSRLSLRMRDAGGPREHRLFLMLENAISRSLMGGRGSRLMFEAVLYPHLQRRLMAVSCGSLWARVGIDRPARDRTHLVRHWFATSARCRGVSDADLAWLQRRKNPKQNRPYVHLPDEDVGELAARTAAVLAAGGDLDAAPAAPGSATTLAAHAAALLRSQVRGAGHED